MTITQKQNKVAELEYWLEHNKNHPDRVIIECDLRKLKLELSNPEAND